MQLRPLLQHRDQLRVLLPAGQGGPEVRGHGQRHQDTWFLERYRGLRGLQQAETRAQDVSFVNCDVVHVRTCKNKIGFIFFFFPLSLKLSFSFKASDTLDSLLVYCSQSAEGQGDFAAVTIKNRHLEFRFDTGKGEGNDGSSCAPLLTTLYIDSKVQPYCAARA